MLNVKSNDGVVEIHEMDGTEKTLIDNIGAIAHKVMLLIANQGAKTKEQVFFKYGLLARQLVEYIETTVQRIDELGQESTGKGGR